MSAGPSLDSVPSLSPRPWLRHGPKDVPAGRKLTTAEVPDALAEERGAASGRLRQPSGSLFGAVNRAGVIPFRRIPRMFPGKGAELVALGHSHG
jgi:hypothetical protein